VSCELATGVGWRIEGGGASRWNPADLVKSLRGEPKLETFR
jgi:hypothetical protein